MAPCPHARLVVTVPFWLAVAPRPMPPPRRQRVLRDAVRELARSEAGALVSWRLAELVSLPDPSQVVPPGLWHPATVARLKGCVLEGRIDAAEGVSSDELGLPRLDPGMRYGITGRRILLYDHGLGSVEYTLEVDARGAGDPDAIMLDAAFWHDLRMALSDAVVGRRLGLLRDGAWTREMSRLSSAMQGALRRECGPGLEMPITSMFWRHRRDADAEVAHLFVEHGVNLLLFAAGDGGGTAEQELERQVRAMLGRQMVQADASQGAFADYRAASHLLTHVVHGAVNSAVIIPGHPGEPGAEATAEAAGTLLRLAWLKYCVLREASDGLLAKQSEWGFAACGPVSGVRETSRRILHLNQAEQLSRILLAEFEPSRFWDTEFEQDIVHRAHELWKMPDVERVFREQLAAVAAIERDLHGRAEERRQRLLRWSLTVIAALTLISAVKDFVDLYKDGTGVFGLTGAHLTNGLMAILVLLLVAAWRNAPRPGG